MIVYHGSAVEVKAPDLVHSRANVDFGRGFYVTPLQQQAQKWASRFVRKNGRAVVCRYQLSDEVFSACKVLCFDSYSEEWLDFVLNCRRSQDITDFDIVTGGVANDKVFNTVELYFDGLIDKKEAIRRLRFEQPNLQVCLRTPKALSYLTYEGSEWL